MCLQLSELNIRDQVRSGTHIIIIYMRSAAGPVNFVMYYKTHAQHTLWLYCLINTNAKNKPSMLRVCACVYLDSHLDSPHTRSTLHTYIISHVSIYSNIRNCQLVTIRAGSKGCDSEQNTH